jgi:thiol-disulfide isomerase/thioredoxin
MVRALLSFLVLCSTATSALADAKITLIVKTSYPSEMKISHKDGFLKPKVIWRQPVESSTVLIATVDPSELDQYLIQDANAIATIWTRLEDGDSLAFAINLDSGTFTLAHDKLGYVLPSGRINQRYAHYQKRLDSALQVLPFNTFQRHTKLVQEELERELRSTLDSLGPSKRHDLQRARIAYLSTGATLKYLRSNWSDATKSSLCGKQLSYTALVGSSHKHDDIFSEAASEWFNVLNAQAIACGQNPNMDSIELAFVNSFSGRRRSIAYIIYSHRKMSQNENDEVAHDLHSRLQSFVSESDLVARYEAMIAERLRLSPGSIAPDIELPDSNGVLRKLSDLRGKIVLIDFWGTWCRPCIGELPHIESIAKTYANADVQILGVALENKKVTPWTTFIRQRSLPGMQLYAESQWNNEQIEPYNISSVPRYVLIDRNGKIISSNAPRPSNPKLREMIDAALKSR